MGLKEIVLRLALLQSFDSEVYCLVIFIPRHRGCGRLEKPLRIEVGSSSFPQVSSVCAAAGLG